MDGLQIQQTPRYKDNESTPETIYRLEYEGHNVSMELDRTDRHLDILSDRRQMPDTNWATPRRARRLPIIASRLHHGTCGGMVVAELLPGLR